MKIKRNRTGWKALRIDKKWKASGKCDMKRYLACLLAIAIALSLCACGGGSSTAVTPDEESASDIPAADVTEDNKIAEYSSETAVDIEWTEFSYAVTDSDGYTVEITYELSPWILLSNTEIIESVWSEIGGGFDLPTSYNSWGLVYTDGGYLRKYAGANSDYFLHTMNDMYYCMGTVQIKNKTDGWSFSSDRPYTVDTALTWMSNYDMVDYGGIFSIGRVFYSNSAKDCDDGIFISAKMAADSWGPIPFIVMAPENFSPNSPDGAHTEDMLNGYMYKGKTSLQPVAEKFDIAAEDRVYLGTIGFDGEYTPPIDTTYIKKYSIPLLDEGTELVIKGHSMEPTILDGDKVTITHPTDGYVSGDIIIVQMSNVSDNYIVSRIIATEGQTVDIDFETGTVYVDGIALDEPYASSTTIDPVDFTGPQLVPDGCVFILGDNRNGAVDSRTADVGMIKIRYILGEVA